MKELKIDKKFLVVGCGGLGCSIVESLLRLHVKAITVCDGDVFDESNLNRQIYALPSNIGEAKVSAAYDRASELEYDGEFTACEFDFDKDTSDELLEGVDIVIDALDNVEGRLLLEDECEKRNIPLVHGAVNEWTYQVGVVMPGKKMLHSIFENKKSDTNVNYPFTVAACAAKEVSEAVLLSLGQISDIENKLYVCDLRDDTVSVIPF